MKGKILSTIAGKYTVYLENKQIIEFSPRGKLKHQKITLAVGDEVEVDHNTIIDVYQRKNFIYRPRIANIDLIIIVTSLKEPDFSSYLLDKFLTLVNIFHLKPMIILTKEDLLQDDLMSRKIIDDYTSLGIDVMIYSKGMEEKVKLIREKIKGKVVALTGQTGAGKSTLINQLFPFFNREEGEFSKALKRGKHQTKEVKLLPYEGGFIADTPGFSSLELNIYREELASYFPFFQNISSPCFFLDCLHIKEKGCKVKDMVERGIINKEHYDNYLAIYQELTARKDRFS